MSIITLPANLRIGAGGGMGQVRFDTVSQSDSSGAQQVRLLAPPRWTMRLVQPANLTRADAAAWQAMALQLRGRVNVLAAWDHARPEPAGSARGVLVTSGTTAAGATSLVITGAKHKNLLAYPSTLDNGVWSKSSTTITADAVAAPDGTMSADTAVVTASSSGGVFQNYAATPGLAYTFSFWALRSASTAASYRVYDNTNAANVVISSYYSAISASAWVRVSVSFTAPVGCVSFRCYPCADGGAGVPHGASIWGCQLEIGALTEYAAAPTLSAGDWLQVGTGLGTSHYCMVTADAQATDAGVLTVAIEPPTRETFTGGTAVAWDKPLAYYRQQTDATTWSMAPGGLFGPLVTGLSLDLMETWQ